MSVDDLGFNPKWLTARFPFDSKARNQQVEAACLDYLGTSSHPVIVDLGCGNGANTKYFIDRLNTDHTWILVDNDQRLLNHALEHLSQQNDYEVTAYQATQGLLLKKNDQQITVKTVCGSLLELDQLLDLKTIDLLMANAVFDLFSEAQFTGFAHLLQQHRLPFLSTLNYAGMGFSPSSDNDELFIGYYEAHMQREQSFGQGMGKQCAELMPEILNRLNASLTVGTSKWDIAPADKSMLNFMYHYLDDSLHELPLRVEEERLLEEWLADKRKSIDLGVLGLEVGHRDLFGVF